MDTKSQHIPGAGHGPNTADCYKNGDDGIHPRRYAHIVIKEPNTTEPKKAKRKRITPEQLKDLTAVFETTDTPTHDVREGLSKKLNMTNREVQVWFQNRRAKYSRLRIEQQRQMRTNAAIIYSAGMITRAPVPVAVPIAAAPAHVSTSMPAPPPPLHAPPATYSHLQQQHAHPTAPLPSVPNTLDGAGTTADRHACSVLLRNTPANYGPEEQCVRNNHLNASRLLPATIALPDTLYTASRYNALDVTGAAGPLKQQHGQEFRPYHHSGEYAAAPTTPLVSPTRLYHHHYHNSDNPRRRYSQQHSGQNSDPGNFAPNGRRNTLSGYQDSGASSDVCINSNSGQGTQSCLVRSPSLAQHASATSARTRYMSGVPAYDFHGRHKRSAHCHYSPSDLSTQSNHDRHYMATEATGQAYVSPTERVSPPITSTVDTTSTDRRTIKLPSFRTMLAMVEDVANKPCESSMNSGTKFSGSTPREQYHRLPTPRNNVENHVAARLPSQLSERYAESQINDAKMGIDVLATAAVSISSANGSGSLPHLTPLSEFSVRGAPSHSMQPPAYVLRQSYSHQQHPPQKDEEVGLCLARSRKVTPSDGREHDARHNWRPW